MEDTMRDLLSKLDAILGETELKDKADLEAKRQALANLEADPVASKDPEISQAIDQRKADLEKEAKTKGFDESFEIDRSELKPAHDKGYADAAKGIDKNPFDYGTPAFKSYREGQLAYKRHFGESTEDLFQVGDDFGISFSEDLEIATEIVDMMEDGIVIELDEAAMSMLEQNGVSFHEVQFNEEKQKGLDGKACWKGYRRMGTKMKGGKRVDNCVKVSEDHGPEDPNAEYNQGEYDREGDMAKDQLRTIDSAAEELYAIISANENLPEWVQKKITLAMDYIDTVRDYMKANKYVEDFEVDEAKYQGREVPLGKPMKGDVKKSKVYVRGPKGNVVKVNFGDKKMRIKKSNPNRRKSFRARHNCSNPGPRHKARYWSCRAW
jgi:hypothetical protein